MKTTGGLDLRHAAFSKPPLHIPNKKGFPFKTELVEVRDPERQTIKWVFWHAPDDDRLPHNHPWDFASTIVHGGYTERRWTKVLGEGEGTGTGWQMSEHTYRAGDVNTVARDVFHEVIAVEPGTVTRMVCGPATPENEWGYLHTETGAYERAQPDPSYVERLRANNRFMK